MNELEVGQAVDESADQPCACNAVHHHALASHPRCARRRRRRLGLSLVVLLDPLCQVFCQRDVPCSLVTSPGFKGITRNSVVEPRAKPFDCLPESSPAGLVAGSNSSKHGGQPLRFRGDRRVLGLAGPAKEVFKRPVGEPLEQLGLADKRFPAQPKDLAR